MSLTGMITITCFSLGSTASEAELTCEFMVHELQKNPKISAVQLSKTTPADISFYFDISDSNRQKGSLYFSETPANPEQIEWQVTTRTIDKLSTSKNALPLVKGLLSYHNLR